MFQEEEIYVWLIVITKVHSRVLSLSIFQLLFISRVLMFGPTLIVCSSASTHQFLFLLKLLLVAVNVICLLVCFYFPIALFLQARQV